MSVDVDDGSFLTCFVGRLLGVPMMDAANDDDDDVISCGMMGAGKGLLLLVVVVLVVVLVIAERGSLRLSIRDER